MKVAESYSVIVIPKDRAKIRRVVVSRWRILGTILMALGCVFVTLVITFGLIYYHDEYVATQELRNRGQRYEQERLQVLSRLAELESVMRQNAEFARRLETVLGIQPAKGVEVGVGGDSRESGVDSSLELAALLPKAEGNSLDPAVLKAYGLKAVDLVEEVKDLNERLQEIYHFNPDTSYFWTSIPSISPLNGWVTSDFGMRRAPVGGYRQFHQGMDIASPYGSPVMVTGDGVVTFAGRGGGLGNKVVVDHGYGIISTYGHNSSVLVREGQKVQRGQVISRVGVTGRSTGPHLHYEVTVDGVPVDPRRFLLERL